MIHKIGKLTNLGKYMRESETIANEHVRLTSSVRTLQFLIRQRTKRNREEKLIVLHIFRN